MSAERTTAETQAANSMRLRAAAVASRFRTFADRDTDRASHYRAAADVIETAILALPLFEDKP